MTRPSLAAAFLALAACAVPGAPMNLSAEEGAGAAGSITLDAQGFGRQIEFAPERVQGERIDLVQVDGAWVGVVDGIHTRIAVAPGRITGQGLDLHVYEDAASRTMTVQGWVGGSRTRFEVRPGAIEVDSLVLTRVSETEWSGAAAAGPFTLRVDRSPDVRSPQFVLALVDALPRRTPSVAMGSAAADRRRAPPIEPARVPKPASPWGL